MSSDQNNKDSSTGLGSFQNTGGSQPHSDSQANRDNTGAFSKPYGSGIGSNNQENQYKMSQSHSSAHPNYGQTQIPPSYNNYMSGSPYMGGESMGGQPQSSQSHMMGHTHMPQNQPPIGSSGYQHYSQSMGIDKGLGQKFGGGLDSSMSQGYMHPGQMTGIPSTGMNSAPGTFQTSQGEKTYEPGMPGQMTPNMSAMGSYTIRNLPLSPEAMKEFEEKAVRSKTYKQTDVFPAVLLKNEDDSIRVIEYLKKNGVSLTATDTLDQTALFYAARDGRLQVVNLLLENGCNPNHRDIYGQTAIYYAARENRIDVAERLMDAGSDLNNEDMHQQTCLFYAAKQGNIDMWAKLIDHGANINHTDNKKQSALHWAQKSKKAETVDYLISRGASPITRKNDRKKPGIKKKPTNERKEPKKYVLTTFVNGSWLPLSDEDYERLEKECPEVAKIIRDPSELEKLEIPEIADDVPIYDHWEKPAKRIINNLWKHESAWLFHSPVDVKAWGIEDYYTIVKDPMDFTTIKGKLSNNEYKSLDDFVTDVHKVFDNCILYNGESNQYSMVAKKMRKEFETQYNNLSMDFYKK